MQYKVPIATAAALIRAGVSAVRHGSIGKVVSAVNLMVIIAYIVIWYQPM